MKISIARKNLFQEKARFVISVGGVAFSVLLILTLLGLYQGWSQKMTRFIDETPADYWVMQKGASDMFHSISLFPNEYAEKIRAINGIESVNLLLGRQITFDINDKDAHLVVTGYDTETNVGGPPEVVEGADVPQSGEIIIDEVFANDKELVVGDVITINDHDFTIAGISTGGNLVMFQYSFMPMEDARALFQMNDVINYALVNFNDSVDHQKVINAMEEQFPELQVVSKQEFSEANKALITESFLPIIYVLVVIGFIVGLMVISLTIYTTTIEKIREYGLLKAVGAKQYDLYKIVMEQSVYAGILGYIVGLSFTYIASSLAQIVEPSFLTYFRWEDAALVFGITILMIAVSAVIPVRRISSIDPAIVFKA